MQTAAVTLLPKLVHAHSYCSVSSLMSMCTEAEGVYAVHKHIMGVLLSYVCSGF